MSRLQDILRDYLYIRLLRNMINHANDQSVNASDLLEYLVGYGYMNINEVNVRDIRRVLHKSLERLKPPG